MPAHMIQERVVKNIIYFYNGPTKSFLHISPGAYTSKIFFNEINYGKKQIGAQYKIN